MYNDSMRTATYTNPDQISPDFRQYPEVLVQIFTSLNNCSDIRALIDEVRAALPQARIIGATGGAKIHDGRLTYDPTLISVSAFTSSFVRTGIVYTSEDVFENAAGLTHALQASSSIPPKAAIVFSEGLHMDGEVLINSIAHVLPDLIIAGGMASDDYRFEKTKVFTEEGCSDKGFVMAMLFGDDLKVYNRFNFNWIGLGRTFKVTKAQGNRVWELDNTPIIDIYKRYLSEAVAERLPDIGLEFPMIISNKEMPIARAVLVKHDDGSLSFAGSIGEGESVRFGFGNSEGIIADADTHADYFSEHPVESLFVYSCIARLSLVGGEIEQETLRLQHFAPTSGFYTYGEFYHAIDQKANRFLNQTMTILGLAEGTCAPTRCEALPLRRPRTSLMASAMSHFIREITSDMEKAFEAERQSKEIMLHQSRQATIGETIEIIAHQWRQPLNVVALVLQDTFVKKRLGVLTLELLEANYEKANGALQYLSQTIDDFRDFMRPGNEIERFSAAALMDETRVLLKGFLQKYDITLDEQINDGHVLVTCKNALIQSLLILLYNAVDAIAENRKDGGVISVSTTRKNDQIIWRVCDNGGGVPPQYAESIFEPYFTTKKKKHGTGMGLYIAGNLAKRYLKGTITLENGQDGACFLLRIAEKIDIFPNPPLLP